MKNYLARRLMFRLIPSPELVSFASGWSNEDIDVDEQTPPQWANNIKSIYSNYSWDELEAVRYTYEIILGSSDFTLQAKLDEVELAEPSAHDRVLGHVPVAIDDTDLAGWFNRPLWTPQQASFLSMGLKPTDQTIETFDRISHEGKRNCQMLVELSDRISLLRDLLSKREVERGIEPIRLIDILLEYRENLPKQLVDFHAQSKDEEWIDSSVVRQTQSSLNNELADREKATLFKLIAAMSMGRYKYDPSKETNSSTSWIRDDLEIIGLSLDSKTIRKWLSKASEIVDKQNLK